MRFFAPLVSQSVLLAEPCILTTLGLLLLSQLLSFSLGLSIHSRNLRRRFLLQYNILEDVFCVDFHGCSGGNVPTPDR